jgi:hypothetical protein
MRKGRRDRRSAAGRWETIMTEAEEAVARSAIRHVLSVYNNAGDHGRLDELLAQFADDAVFEVPDRQITGLPAIRDYFTNITGRRADLRGSRHHLTTSRIEFDNSDEARGWTYWIVSRHGTALQEGMYVDRFARRDGRWKFTHRRVKVLWMAES